ncbi:putative 3'-5' exonuclease, partial [Ascoidea rubescens DSM 1968]
ILEVNHSDSERRKHAGKYVSLDCEFVGVGPEGSESALARVSIVNFYGHVLLDTFVRPLEKVVDWRTRVSGVTPAHMKNAILFKEAQKTTSDILKNRILIGHAVYHDLKALLLSHPSSMTRDTSLFPPFRAYAKGKTPSLKKLSQQILGKEIQKNEHSSIEDARATVVLYRLYKKDFEKF